MARRRVGAAIENLFEALTARAEGAVAAADVDAGDGLVGACTGACGLAVATASRSLLDILGRADDLGDGEGVCCRRAVGPGWADAGAAATGGGKKAGCAGATAIVEPGWGGRAVMAQGLRRKGVGVLRHGRDGGEALLARVLLDGLVQTVP